VLSNEFDLSGSDRVKVMSFYRNYIYPRILKGLGDPKPSAVRIMPMLSAARSLLSIVLSL
jgi:hypothetical protein